MSSNNNTVITENVFPANDTSTIGTNTSQFEEVNTKHCRAGRLSNKRHSKIRHAKGGKIRSTSVGGKRYKTGSPYTDSSSSSEDDHPKPVDPCPPLHGQHRKCVDLSTCDECYKLITNGNNVSAQPGTVTLDQTNNRLWVNPVNALGNDLTNYFLKLGSDLCVRITDVHHPDNNAIYQLSSFHQVNANLFCATTLLLTDKNLDQDCVFFKGHDSVKLCFKGGAGGSGGAGPTGPTGPTGADGAQGSPGQNGQDGADGAPGAQGPTGATGADGQDGQDGADGAQGPTGADGAQGPPGQDGQDGADGAPGAQGPTGAQGPAGQDGQDGADGAPGAQGPTGAAGPAGQDGADGAPGEVGPTGPPGPVGDIDILTNVSTSGVTSGQHLVYDGVNWTNQDSCLVDLCDVAIVGATGLQDGQVLAWKASTSRFENDFAFNLPGQLGGVNNEGDTGLSTEQTSAGGTGPNLTATNQKTLELNGDISITQEFTKDVNGKLSEYHEVEEMTQQVDETGPISSAPISAVKNELTEVTEEGTVGVDLKKVRKQTDAIKIDNDEVAVKESGLKKNFDQSTTLTSAGSLKQNNANGKDMTYDLTIEQQVQTGVRRDGRVFDIVTHGLSGNAVEVGAVASVVETTDVTRGVRNVVEREIGSEINNITKESVSKKSLGETFTKDRANYTKAGPARADTMISHSNVVSDASQSSGSKSRTFKDVGTGNNVIDRDLSRSGTLNAVKSTRTRNGRTTELHTVVGNGNFDGYDGTIELEDELDGTTRALNRKCVRAAFGGEDEVDLTHRTRDTTGTKKKTNVVKAGPARVDTVISQSETNYDASQSSGSKSRTFKDVGTGNNVIDRDLSRSGTLNAVKSTRTRNGRTTELHTVVGNGNFDGYDGTIELEDELDGTTRALNRKCVRAAFGGEDEVDLTHRTRDTTGTKKKTNVVKAGPARVDTVISQSETNYDASQSSGSKSRTFKDVGTGNNVIDRDLSRSGTLNAVKSTGTRNGRTTELHTVVGNGNFDGYDGTIELEDELDGTTRALTRKCVRGAFGGDDEVDLTHTSRSNVHTKKSSSQVVDGARGNVMVSDSQVVKQDGNTQITHKWYSGNTARSRAIRAVDYATYHNSAEFGTYASRIVNGVGSSVLQTAGGAFTSWTDVNGTETFNANNGATVEDAGVRFLLTDGLTSSRIDVGGGAVVSAAGSGVYFAGILSLNDASNDNGVFLDFTASDTVPAATDLRVVYDADLGGAGANPFLKFEVDGTTFGSMPTSGIEGLLFLAFTIDNSGNLNIYFNDEPVQAVPDVGGKLAAVQFRYLTLGRNLVASDPGSVESAIAELAVASAIGTDVTAINTVLGQQWGLLPGPSELQISTNVTTQSTRGRYSRATGNEIAVAGTNNTLIGCYRESVDPGGNENEVEITAACKLMEAFIDESELAPELQSGGGGSRNGRNVFQKIVNVFNNLQNQINNMSGGSGNPPGGQFTVNFNTLISELGGSAAIQDVLLLNDNGGNGEFDTIQVDYLDNGGSPVTRYLFVNPTYCNITNVASNDPSPGEYSFTTTNNQLEFAADSTNNPIGGSPATFWTVTNDPLLVWNPVASSGTQVALSQNFEVTEGEPDFQVEYRHLLQVSGSGAALDMVNTSTTTITDDTAVVDLDDGKSVNLVYDRTIVGVGNGVNEFHLTFAVPASQYSPGNQPVNFLSLNHGLPPPSFSVTYDGNTFTGTPIQLNDKNIDVDVTASY